MNKSFVFSILKSSRLGRREMVHNGTVRSVLACPNNTAGIDRRLMQVLHINQKPSSSLLRQLNYICTARHAQCSENDESVSELEVALEDTSSDSDVEGNDSHLHRRFLCPDSQDPIIIKLNDCVSVQDVFDIVTQHESELNGQHASQAVLILWDMQKINYRVNKEANYERPDSDASGRLVEDYITKIVSHENFNKIVNCLEYRYTELSPDAACCTFLYFKRMGIPFYSTVMQKLLFHIEILLEKERNLFPMTALSRFTVALSGNSSLSFLFAVKKAIPLIYTKIDNCQSEENMRLLIICMNNISHLIDSAALNAFKYKVDHLLDTGVYSTVSNSTVAKTALFFSNPYWAHRGYDVNRKLLLLLKERISSLTKTDVIRVHKVMENQLESAELRRELSERASHFLSEKKNHMSIENESLKLLICVASSCPPTKRKSLEKLIADYMKQELNPNAIASLFKIIRYLKISDIELCNTFWFKTLEVMREYPRECSVSAIGKYTNRYMHFNNNLGGTFRQYEFEKQMMEWYLYHYQKGIIGHIPSKLVDMVSFFVAYSDKPDKNFVNNIEELIIRLCDMSSQLHAVDCAVLSRGIQIAEQLQNSLSEKPWKFNILVKLNSLLNSLIENQMQSLDYRLEITNTMMRSYVMRKAPQTTDIFEKLVARYENFCGSVNSRLLRDAVHNFLSSKCVIPRVLDRLTEFIIQNRTHLFGETVEIITFLCYYLGYTPPNTDAFFEACSEVIVRESEHMSGLSVLQSCLSLCFFHYLPEKLVHLIFTVDFLERLDREIANCYAKAVYPLRVRNYLMQLNRAVCLDYPEYDVPWFHKKYCEEMAVTDAVQTSVFYSEVKETLINTLGEKSLVKTDSYSPYGYKIDFEIFVNKNNVPVSWKHQTDKNISRKAIVLLKEEAFSKNVKLLNGYSQMKKRHLEILGYEVIEIEQTLWNSMYMSEPGMKYKFIQEKVLKSETEKICEMFH